MNKLSKAQQQKLSKMYASLEKMEKVDRKTVATMERVFGTNKGIVGQQDWFMREFSRKTMEYFKDH
jgi:hypothetical protein